MMPTIQEMKENIWQVVGSLVFLVGFWALMAFAWLALP